jgi:uncharacterized protein YidB (DUF937 family)
MSPLTMALLGVLAYKALKHFGGAGAQGTATRPGPVPGGGAASAGAPGSGAAASTGAPGGSLADMLGGLFGGQQGSGPAAARPGASSGGLGGLLGGAAAGSVLTAGLEKLMREFQESGHGGKMQSWISTGPNQDIAPRDLADALGGDTVSELSQRTGMGRDELLAGLSRQLPDFINQLTPQGRLPTSEEASEMV